MDSPWAARLCGAVAVLIGATVLLGWALHLPLLAEIRPGWVAMVINTAAGLALGGVLLLLAGWTARWIDYAKNAGGALMLVVGILVLAENITGHSVGIDWADTHRWLLDQNPNPGRMAPNTCIGFILIGLAVLAGGQPKHRHLRLAEAFSLVALAIGASGILGYFLKLELLYSWHGVARMAVHTGIGISALGLGFLDGCAQQAAEDRARG